ncbi:hypothetical protein B0T25DRAFT_615574 [Lasiosphaeria hispida]|uniref:Uncharacterized protein n=1 Tax=Lasiosphaeria hispida TaxID=260671 RepID=A0AAJ0M9K4_9PEZI|nr:hypothetical protein B0T25DRAFT_615574 [Lasiosphaeria hispida]
MSTAVVDLGSISVATKQSLLSLTVSSSFSIGQPLPWPQPPTPAELSQSSKAGEIWIAKGGSCQIDFRAIVNVGLSGTASCDPNAASKVVHMAAECPVWKEIGLELRVKHSVPQVAPGQCHTQTSYFLHHPDLSSEMIAPSHIPSARFQGLTCELNFHLHNGKREAKAIRNVTAPQATAKNSGHRYSLRRDPRSTKKVLAAMDGSLKESITSFRQVGELEQDGLDSASPLKAKVGIGDMVSLLDIALRRLIGVERASPGIKTTRSMPSPSLIDMAPAVWNLRYLQSLETHARIIPTIADGMARLTNARSASLREKLGKFARSRALISANEGAEQYNLTSNEIKKRLWFLCQTGQQVPEQDLYHTRIELGEFEEAQMSSHQRNIGAGEEFSNGLYSQMTVYDPLDVSRETSDMVVYEGVASLRNPGRVFQDQYTQEVLELTPYDPYLHMSPWQYQDGTTWEGGFREEDDEFSEYVGDETCSEVSTDDAESGYFYADGQGNYYPVERDEIAVSAALDWPSSSQLGIFGVLPETQGGEVEQDEYGWQLEPS